MPCRNRIRISIFLQRSIISQAGKFYVPGGNATICFSCVAHLCSLCVYQQLRKIYLPLMIKEQEPEVSDTTKLIKGSEGRQKIREIISGLQDCQQALQQRC